MGDDGGAVAGRIEEGDDVANLDFFRIRGVANDNVTGLNLRLHRFSQYDQGEPASHIGHGFFIGIALDDEGDVDNQNGDQNNAEDCADHGQYIMQGRGLLFGGPLRGCVSFSHVFYLVALILTCGAAYAYIFMRTDAKSTQFVPAKVDCEVTESGAIVVKNTSNVDAYIRVRLVSYWVDGSDNIVAKASVMPSFTLNTADWVGGSDNTYYYKTPVAPGGFTTNLLPSAITLQTDGEYKQVLDIFSEAIQAKPGKAVKDSWVVTLDSNGYIVSAP